MRSELARLGWISLDFAGIPPRWDKNLSYEHVAGGPARQGGIDFSLKRMCIFEILSKFDFKMATMSTTR